MALSPTPIPDPKLFDPNQIITLVIAIYGALVATIVGYRGLKRRISVFLEYVDKPYERAQITITNVGQRPMTIIDVNVTYKTRDKWEPISKDSLFIHAPDVDIKSIPFTLNDGEFATLPLNKIIGEVLRLENGVKKIRVKIFDIEGNTYTKFKFRKRDPRWGSINMK
jgi:hypothetical protein